MSEATGLTEPAIEPGRWRHRGGALYDVLGPCKGRHPGTGEWLPGVLYASAEDRRSCYWRSLPDFLASFQKIKEEIRG